MHKYFGFQPVSEEPDKALHLLKLEDWLEIDATNEKRLLKKEQILRQQKDLVLYINAEAREACFELEQMVREHLLRYFSDQFSMAASELYVNATGYSFSKAQTAEQALTSASQYAQEDFAIFNSEGKVMAACLCLTSGGVNGFNLEPEVLKILTIEKPLQKISWSIQDNEIVYERQTFQIMPKTKYTLVSVRSHIHPVG